jgi:hypothetical protein
MDQININNLSAEDRKALMAQLTEEQRKDKHRKQADRQAYRLLIDENIPELFKVLAHASEVLTIAKKKIFDATKSLVDLKISLYGAKDDQQSHTFTTNAGTFSITIGHRVNDGWDDTVTIGVTKVKEFLGTLATDEQSARLIKTILRLLKPDKKGMLRASRVIELANLADEIDNPEFSEGMKIIQEAYRPMKSVDFVEASWRDEHGKEHSVPLSISACELI